MGESLGSKYGTKVGSSTGLLGGIVKIKVEGSLGVSDKGESGARVVMSSRNIAMGTDTVVSVRVVMAAGSLTRGADAVVGAAVVSSAGSYDLRSGVICCGAAGEEIWMVGVSE